MDTSSRQRDGHINARSQDAIRASIKAQEIVDCLNAHILGQLKMTNTQVRAAEILLRKIQPDLTATQLTTDDGQGVPLLKIVRSVPAAELEHEPSGVVCLDDVVAEHAPDGADTEVRHALAPSSEVESD